jgi:hypothetical protein
MRWVAEWKRWLTEVRGRREMVGSWERMERRSCFVR